MGVIIPEVPVDRRVAGSSPVGGALARDPFCTRLCCDSRRGASSVSAGNGCSRAAHPLVLPSTMITYGLAVRPGVNIAVAVARASDHVRGAPVAWRAATRRRGLSRRRRRPWSIRPAKCSMGSSGSTPGSASGRGQMKQLVCRDAGFDCDAVVRAETDEDVLAQVRPHAQEARRDGHAADGAAAGKARPPVLIRAPQRRRRGPSTLQKCSYVRGQFWKAPTASAVRSEPPQRPRLARRRAGRGRRDGCGTGRRAHREYLQSPRARTASALDPAR
jgi:predicted small metal-binding protein